MARSGLLSKQWNVHLNNLNDKLFVWTLHLLINKILQWNARQNPWNAMQKVETPQHIGLQNSHFFCGKNNVQRIPDTLQNLVCNVVFIVIKSTHTEY